MMLLKCNKVIRIVIDPNLGADRWPTLREAACLALTEDTAVYCYFNGLVHIFEPSQIIFDVGERAKAKEKETK